MQFAQRGDTNTALAFWKRSFHQDPGLQLSVIEMLAQAPAEEFLREFEPDRLGLHKLFHFYQRSHAADQAKIVAPHFLVAIQQELSADGAASASAQAALWDQVRIANELLGDTAGATDAARQAVTLIPDSYQRHLQLAHMLDIDKQYDEACREFQWCLSRRPDDQAVQRRLTAATRMRLATASDRQRR